MKFTRNRQHSKYVEPPPKRDDSGIEISTAEIDALCAAIAEMEKAFSASMHELGELIILELANYSATTRTHL